MNSEKNLDSIIHNYIWGSINCLRYYH